MFCFDYLYVGFYLIGEVLKMVENTGNARLGGFNREGLFIQ